MFNFSHVLIHNNSMEIYKDEPLSASQVHTNYLKAVNYSHLKGTCLYNILQQCC